MGCFWIVIACQLGSRNLAVGVITLHQKLNIIRGSNKRYERYDVMLSDLHANLKFPSTTQMLETSFFTVN